MLKFKDSFKGPLAKGAVCEADWGIAIEILSTRWRLGRYDHIRRA